MKNLLWLCAGCLVGLSIKKRSEPKYVVTTSNDHESLGIMLKTKEAEKVILEALKKHSYR